MIRKDVAEVWNTPSVLYVKRRKEGNTFSALCKKIISKVEQMMTRPTQSFMIMAHKSSRSWRTFFLLFLFFFSPWTWISSQQLLGKGGLTCFSLWFLKRLSRLRSRGILILKELGRASTAKNPESTKVIFILHKRPNSPLCFLCQHFSMINKVRLKQINCESNETKKIATMK